MLFGVLATLAIQTGYTYRLESLELKSFVQGWGSARSNRSVDGNPLKIGGQSFANGVGTHAESEVSIRLDRKAVRFQAKVGIDAEVKDLGSVEFVVLLDDKVVWRSGVMRGGQAPKAVDLDTSRANTITLSVEDGGDGINYDHADWADAVFLMLPNAPAPIADKLDANVPDPVLAEVAGDKTEFHGPKVVGTTPGRDFIFRIPVTGKQPVQVKVSGLPKGLVYDERRRIIVGKVEKGGEYKVNLKASGPGGSDSRQMKIVAGSDKLALTPPMGWNSWNVWGLAVDTNKARAAADAFVKLGLADSGYQFVNIDDGWEQNRAANGEIQTNDRFRDMKAFTDYCHSLGLKAGLYSSPGPTTCGGYLGSYQHEIQDAQSYAKWGFDYLKYDWCSYGEIAPTPDLTAMKLPYSKMKSALEASGRDIVFSLCQYGMGDVFQWGREVGGNLWRTTGDITDSWSSMSSIGFDHSRRSPFVKPGGWNDPDMLVVGYVGWGPNVRPTSLTKHEQLTHITLWSMLAAPLLLGCDLTRLDDFTRRLICNHDMIEVDQDPVGRAATRVWQSGKIEAWSRPLEDGSYAVAVFNRGLRAANYDLGWKEFGIPSRFGKFDREVKNIWERKDLGRLKGLKGTVQAHGAVFFRVK